MSRSTGLKTPASIAEKCYSQLRQILLSSEYFLESILLEKKRNNCARRWSYPYVGTSHWACMIPALEKSKAMAFQKKQEINVKEGDSDAPKSFDSHIIGCARKLAGCVRQQ
ncbi:hypothetical protein [Paraburkholderia sp. J67]|uniref:hypothetical protein n=1 Tax=Paraburkholderia sp. J67 TaxID=2805435 RepID=UPI002ABE5E44|nr:hypothetical protein [Paraburkholderia sp. J67]